MSDTPKPSRAERRRASRSLKRAMRDSWRALETWLADVREGADPDVLTLQDPHRARTEPPADESSTDSAEPPREAQE